MHLYEPKTFAIPELDGISKKTMEEHLGLYQGYVKNFNVINGLITEFLRQDSEKNAHAISELVRRRSFEFGGMRLHEYYFAQFENGMAPLAAGSALTLALSAQFRDMDTAIMHVRQTAMMRGPGWSILYYDPQVKQFHVGFSGEQHQGHFVMLPIILALDVWEHAFILDYGAQGKAKYIDAFFKNLNWVVIESRFAGAGRG
jgi:Fe-Mn family superoxide dismutase